MRRGTAPSSLRHTIGTFAAAAVCLAASLAVFWPGYALYDTIAQFEQVVAGEYTDWHPPAMARLWAMLHRAVGGGTAPMFVLQMALYWLGFALLAGVLARVGRRRAAAAVLLVALWPPFLGWQAVVLKDAQMTGAIVACVGLVAWWRLRGARVPAVAWATVALLLGYATLVRANAVFVTVPLAVMLVPGWRWWVRAVAGVVATLAVLVLSGPINHELLEAEPTGVERSQALYDLAGIAVRVPDATDLPFDAGRHRLLIERRCVTPFFWDPLGDPGRCDDVVEPLRDVPVGQLYGDLARAILHHPIAYASHRLAHLNSTDRWLVRAGWVSAAPPQVNQPNGDGLAPPGPAAGRFQKLGGRLVEMPLAWPVTWIAIALAALPVAARRERSPARDLALALLVSGLMLEASFTGLSIASDLRYHLWPMIGTALAGVLLGRPRREERRFALWSGAAVLLVVGAGTLFRAVSAPAPTSYQAMLAA